MHETNSHETQPNTAYNQWAETMSQLALDDNSTPTEPQPFSETHTFDQTHSPYELSIQNLELTPAQYADFASGYIDDLLNQLNDPSSSPDAAADAISQVDTATHLYNIAKTTNPQTVINNLRETYDNLARAAQEKDLPDTAQVYHDKATKDVAHLASNLDIYLKQHFTPDTS